jgi:FlaA1/EpsC-like NDP-sugar epimerase
MPRYRILLIFWLLTDLLVFAGSYALAYFARVGWIFSNDFPFDPYIKIVLLIAPVWLLILVTTRIFALTRRQLSLRSFAFLLYTNVVGAALFTLSYYFLYGLFFSRLLVLLAFVSSTVALLLWHALFEQILRRSLSKDPPAFPTLIIGITRESKKLVTLLKRTHSPLKPVAILDAGGAKEKEIDGVPVLGKLNKLEETLERFGITHMIQCSDLEQSLNLLSSCRSRGITYLILPSVLGIVERDERITSLEGKPATMVASGRGWWGWFFT